MITHIIFIILLILGVINIVVSVILPKNYQKVIGEVFAISTIVFSIIGLSY